MPVTVSEAGQDVEAKKPVQESPQSPEKFRYHTYYLKINKLNKIYITFSKFYIF